MIAKKIVLLLPFFFLISCKKDKLKGDKEVLIGTWSWYLTKKANSLCDPPGFESELNPISQNKSYSLKFYEQGKVEFVENEVVLNEYRVVFTKFGGPACDPGYTYFGIDLDNDEEMHLYGCVSFDSLVVIDGFPFIDPEDACENFTSYFVKQ